MATSIIIVVKKKIEKKFNSLLQKSINFVKNYLFAVLMRPDLTIMMKKYNYFTKTCDYSKFRFTQILFAMNLNRRDLKLFDTLFFILQML